MTRRQAILSITALARPQVDSLVVEIQSKRVVENNWAESKRALFPGSLLKPFVALAYGAAHGDSFPALLCRHCWKPDGHGLLSLPEAVACSCNTYFLTLGRACSPEDLVRTALVYGLPAPSDFSPETYIGLGRAWPVTAASLAGAYCELYLRGSDIGPSLLLAGMRLSAKQGTGRAIGVPAFVKTGTGVCRHGRGVGDGYAVALFPAERPRYCLIAGVHDHPGSEAARLAGDLTRMFR